MAKRSKKQEREEIEAKLRAEQAVTYSITSTRFFSGLATILLATGLTVALGGKAALASFEATLHHLVGQHVVGAPHFEVDGRLHTLEGTMKVGIQRGVGLDDRLQLERVKIQDNSTRIEKNAEVSAQILRALSDIQSSLTIVNTNANEISNLRSEMRQVNEKLADLKSSG